MKKLIYIVLFAFVAAMSVTACTEEEVAPSSLSATGGTDSDPK